MDHALERHRQLAEGLRRADGEGLEEGAGRCETFETIYAAAR